MGTVPGKKCPHIPFMRDVALTGARNPEFKAGFQVLLQQEHTGIRPCGMDRTEKTGRAGAHDCDIVLLHGPPLPEYLF